MLPPSGARWSLSGATGRRATGAWRGHIRGQASFFVSGTVVGHTFTSRAKQGAYTSRGVGTIVTTGLRWRIVRGTFSDSQGTTGTFTGLRLSKTPSG
jgi:hypothetical protein